MNESCTAQLAIATVPLQKAEMQTLHDKPKALDKGTIFPELCLPFFVTETELSDAGDTCRICQLKEEADPENKSLIEIMETSFYLEDLSLYLANHPEDTEALRIYNQHDQELKTMVTNFAKNYYPLSKGSVTESQNKTNIFSWTEGPAPWEGVCV